MQIENRMKFIIEKDSAYGAILCILSIRHIYDIPSGTLNKLHSSLKTQWSQGNVRLQPQFMDGHPLLGSCHRMAQLQIRGEERIGEGSYPREGN